MNGDFDVIGFLERYPEMKPYIGKRYDEARQNGCALLVLGESHYLPGGFTDVEAWYDGLYDLPKDSCDREWLDTARILEKQIANDFKGEEKYVFRRGIESINRHGPNCGDYKKVFDFVVICNYFLRPAEECKSLQVEDLDVTAADARLRQLIRVYAPNAIVFLSRKAFDHAWRVWSELSIPVAGTPHPSHEWWNKKAKKYGNRRGCDVVADAVAGLPWDKMK